MTTNAEMQYRYGRMDMSDLILECERLRAALVDMIEITKRNSNADLMLIAIRKCADHALTGTGGKPE